MSRLFDAMLRAARRLRAGLAKPGPRPSNVKCP
jgi:hypothetical protein